MERIRIACILVIIAVGGCATAPPQPPRVVPFQTVDGLMYIDATVNGGGPYGMIVDTGAGDTILSPAASAAASIKRGKTSSAHGFGPDQQTATRLHGITLGLPGNVQLKSPWVAEASADVFGFLNSTTGERFDGILGYDLFRRFVVEIDPDTSIIRLHEPSTFRYRGDGAKLKLRQTSRKTSVLVKIISKPGDKPIDVWLDLDTGAGSDVALCKPFLERHPLDQQPTAHSYLARGFGGQAMDSYGPIAHLTLGPYDFSGMYAIYSRSSANVGDGVIGQGVLRRFKLFVDYSRNVLILEPRKSLEAPRVRDRSGLYVLAEGPTLREFRVEHIYANTPAVQAGLKVGDRVIEIDGKPASEMSLSELQNRLTKSEPCPVTIRRGKETIQT